MKRLFEILFQLKKVGSINRFWVLALFFLMIAACAPRQVVFTRSRLMMGHVPVNVSIRIPLEQKPQALEASEAAYALAQEIESEISEFQNASDVSCLNRMAGVAYCPIHSATLELLQKAEKISEATGKAFDIRFASPTAEALASPILIDVPNSRAMLSNARTKIGVASIGKGFIVDKMIETLAARGFHDVLIDAGGDLRAAGGPWKVAIQIPEARAGITTKVKQIRDLAWGSSGLYEQGEHIVDPRTREKTRRSGSVTVEGKTLAEAGALGTAFFVLGEAKSAEILAKFPGMRMTWVYPDTKVKQYPQKP